MIDVSVVVPVYNPGARLDVALTSILSQSSSGLDVEVIAVNDRSTDDSASVLAAAQARDPRVKVIELAENMGAGPARNAGLDKAQGRFVAFLDPDDSYPDLALQRLVDAAQRTDAPLIRGNILELDAQGVGHPRESNLAITGLRAFAQTPTLWAPWMHQQFLFRREFLERHSIRYPALRRGQDTVMLSQALAKSESVYLIDSVVYHYTIGVKSAKWGLAQFDNILDHFIMVREAYLSSGHRVPWMNYLNVYWNFWRHLQNGASENFSDLELRTFLEKSASLFTEVAEEFFLPATHRMFSLEPWRLLIYQLLRRKKFDLLTALLRSHVRLDELMRASAVPDNATLKSLLGQVNDSNKKILDQASRA